MCVAQAQAFSLSREEPTASSVVDQGEFPFNSPLAPDDCGYMDGVPRPLREKLPQLPALPEREWPFARGALTPVRSGDAMRKDDDGPEAVGVVKSSMTSLPLKE